MDFVSPRVLFSLALGFGLGGIVAGGMPMIFRLPIAIASALVLELALVRPIWNGMLSFASKPAMTLESAITDWATVVTPFNAQGDGVVSIKLDGQILQLLACLPESEREGPRLRAGEQVRVESVDPVRNRCTVTRRAT